MTWVVIGDMLLDIDNPARSVDIKAIYNNVEAMANGDAGAPEIQEAALSAAVVTKLNDGANGGLFNPSTAGTAFTSKFMGRNSFSYTETTHQPLNNGVYAGSISGSSPAGGVVTVETTSTTNTLVGAQLNIRIYKNGVNIVSFNVPAGVTGQVDTNNVTTARGDTISISCATTAGGTGGSVTVDSSFVKTGNDTLGVI